MARTDAGDASHRAAMRDQDGGRHQDQGQEAVGQLTDSWAAAMSRPSGREPSGRAAAARSAGPHPQVGGTRRHAAPVTACKDRARPVLRAGHPLAAQDHSQGRSLRSRRYRDGRKRPPLSLIFHGKTSAAIGRTGQTEEACFVTCSAEGAG
jgi:hypothetical protein